MNDLERAARPYLESIVVGSQRTLDATALTKVSAWATKTTLALQLASRDATAFPPRYYRQLTADPTRPPPRTQVWLGAYDGFRLTFCQTWLLDMKSSQANGMGFVSTMIIGKAVFQVFLHALDADLTLEKQGVRARMASQIWPTIGEVGWPPAVVIDESSLWRFLQAFAPPAPMT
jgi:hypothetical protein